MPASQSLVHLSVLRALVVHLDFLLRTLKLNKTTMPHYMHLATKVMHITFTPIFAKITPA